MLWKVVHLKQKDNEIITEDLCVSFLIWKMVLDINDFIPLVKTEGFIFINPWILY